MADRINFVYSTVPGIFIQSDPNADADTVHAMQANFGLIDRRYPSDNPKENWMQWERLYGYVQHLNKAHRGEAEFKVLFIARHGEGVHNTIEDRYGKAAWHDYWARLDGVGGVEWVDARLTDVGEDQARARCAQWHGLINDSIKGMVVPDSFYVSPLWRTLQTANMTFDDFGPAYQPVVKEYLREMIGIHTCDRRSTAAQIREGFPNVTLEPGFKEEDPLWVPDRREPDQMVRRRVERLLDDLFTHDGGLFLSLTSHSGAIRNLLAAVGHPPVTVATGEVVAVMVRAEPMDLAVD